MSALFMPGTFCLLPSHAIAQAVVNSNHKCEYSCAGERPACENAWKGDMAAVFLGTVKSIDSEEVPLLSDGQRIVTTRSKVTFNVLDAFRGVDGKTVSVTTGGDLCGFPFSKTKRYLVYADHHTGQQLLHVDICSGTTWEPSAIRKDLAYLRSLNSAPQTSFVYGSFFTYTDPPREPPNKGVRMMKPVIDRKVSLEGAENYSTTTDKAGHFRIDGIPPGDYVLSFTSKYPTYSTGLDIVYGPGPSRKIKLASKGCAEVQIYEDPFATQEGDH